jgi:phosphoglycerate dehydrogenase-like enzyme
MTRLTVFLDPHWRGMEELFSPEDTARLSDRVTLLWGRNEKAGAADLAAALPDIDVLISAQPEIDAATLAAAPKLKAVVEVSGTFPATIDYAACAARGVEVLSCAPGFRQSVAEMCLAMMLAGARGLVAEHEAFRRGTEHWLADNTATDFTLYGQTVGFVGYGSIARETHRLLRPFGPRVMGFDPWIDAEVAVREGIDLLPLDEVLRRSRCLIVAATPTRENRGMIGRRELELMPPGALLVLISRAHLVDFDALLERAAAGHLRAAIDVFPAEPVGAADPLRALDNVILSPHRAAAVPGGRHLIGRMILDDLAALAEGRPGRRLLAASPDYVRSQAGVGDAASVSKMATDRPT